MSSQPPRQGSWVQTPRNINSYNLIGIFYRMKLYYNHTPDYLLIDRNIIPLRKLFCVRNSETTLEFENVNNSELLLLPFQILQLSIREDWRRYLVIYANTHNEHLSFNYCLFLWFKKKMYFHLISVTVE